MKKGIIIGIVILVFGITVGIIAVVTGPKGGQPDPQDTVTSNDVAVAVALNSINTDTNNPTEK